MNECAILKLFNLMLFIKKPFQELEKRYQDTHALFFVQAEAIYHRLEKISKHNLEYFSYFENISKTHEMIKHELDSKAKDQLAKLSIYVKDNQGKAFNALYQPTRITLDVFESCDHSIYLISGVVCDNEDFLTHSVVTLNESNFNQLVTVACAASHSFCV